MAKTVHMSLRLEPELKQDVEVIFRDMGITSSTAVGMFFRQVALQRRLPFDVCVPNEETVAALEEAERGGGKVYHADRGRDLINAILNDDE
jgi:DNA-damage-inducible protein J